MKKTKQKFFALLLLISLLISTYGCVTLPHTEDPETTLKTQPDIQPDTQPETRADGLKKRYFQEPLDDFRDNKVTVYLFPEYDPRNYSTNSFPGIDCIEIQTLSEYDDTKPKWMILTLETNSKQHVLDVIKILEQREDVYSVLPCYFYRPDDSIAVSDSFYAEQWAIDAIDLPAAWDMSTGSSTIYVGIIDSGIDATHPDLVNRVNTTLSKNFVSYNDTALEDADGHGTAIAGIIGAQVNNAIGIAGVCWDVQLVSLRIVEADGSYNENAMAAAIEYAEEMGIQIINFSVGGFVPNDALEAAISNYSGLFVCSAGNSALDIDERSYYPSSYDLPNIISVGASTENETRWSDSNYGKTTVDIFAPGDDICTTFPGGSYVIEEGTSFAVPYVAGVAALMLSIHPELTAIELKGAILDSAEDVYDSDGNVIFGGLCVSDGRLNAYQALTDDSIHTYTYQNEGISTGHKCTCTQCSFTESNSHVWTMYPDYNICYLCGATSMFVTRPLKILTPRLE